MKDIYTTLEYLENDNIEINTVEKIMIKYIRHLLTKIDNLELEVKILKENNE